MLSFVRTAFAFAVVFCTTWVEGVALAAPAVLEHEQARTELATDDGWHVQPFVPELHLEHLASAADAEVERVEHEQEEETSKHARDAFDRALAAEIRIAEASSAAIAWGSAAQALHGALEREPFLARGPPQV